LCFGTNTLSLGGVLGAGAGALAARLGATPPPHFLACAMVAVVGGLAAWLLLLPFGVDAKDELSEDGAASTSGLRRWFSGWGFLDSHVRSRAAFQLEGTRHRRAVGRHVPLPFDRVPSGRGQLITEVGVAVALSVHKLREAGTNTSLKSRPQNYSAVRRRGAQAEQSGFDPSD
jgi:hypothetical protein